MKSMSRHLFQLMVCVLFCFLVLLSSTIADELTQPIFVGGSNYHDSPTLGIPRWKGYMSFTDPDRFWLSYANTSSGSNLSYTTNGGDSFSGSTVQIGSSGEVDFHLSCFGLNNNLYFTWPYTSIMFRKFNYPAQSSTDRDPLRTLSGTSSSHRANVMVQDNGRIWVFTRQSNNSGQNVRYQYSDNGGASWTAGTAYSTGTSNVRIGSMPYVNGNPALVVLHMDSNRGYEYYLWNGSSFEARPDHSIYASNMGQIRVFTHNVVRDTTFHLIFGLGNNLHHVWKNYNNGSGSWNHQTIDNSSTTSDFDWYPISTVKGDDLYLFYCKRGGSISSSDVYYKKWSQISQSWTPPELVSTSPASGYNRCPNTCFQVPENSDYVPVFWNRNVSGYGIYFAKVTTVASPADTVPPGRINDLGAAPGPGENEVTLGWSAPGDDEYEGRVSRYTIKYAPTEIRDENWVSLDSLSSTPSPNQPGQFESFTFTSPQAGPTTWYAIKAYDEAGNQSELSNVAFLVQSYVDEGSISSNLPTAARLINSYPNPFNNSTSIEYSLDDPSHIDISVFNIRGQRVTTLVNESKPQGRHQVEWRGQNMSGGAVASGVYLCQLIAGSTLDSHKLVLLK